MQIIISVHGEHNIITVTVMYRYVHEYLWTDQVLVDVEVAQSLYAAVREFHAELGPVG